MRNTIAILAIALSLAACGEKKDAYSGIPQQPQYQQPMAPQQYHQQAPAQAPVIVNNEQSSVMPALLGAAAGYMLGSSGNRSSNETRVVEREVYREAPSYQQRNSAIGSAVKPPVPTAPPAPAFTAPVVPKPNVAPAPKPNFSQGGYGSTTYSNAKPAAPSVSYGSSFKPSAPAPKPSYSSGSYRSGNTSYSSSRSSGRR